MVSFIIRRLFGGVVVVFFSSVITFLIFQVGPRLSGTNLAIFYVGKIPPTAEGLKRMDHAFGFDLPLWEQYWNWLHGIIFGRTLNDGSGTITHCAAPCLGYSFRLQLPVTQMISNALPVELSLAVGAAILWLVGGMLVGTVSALNKGKFVDRAGMAVALAAVSLPIFFTGPILKLVFQYKLKWLPNITYAPLFDDPAQWFKSLILPWIALSFVFAALYARLTRANVLETMSEDYIRTARAKGLPRRSVIRHGLRSALTPIVTIFGLDLGQLIGTAVITETVFNLHGVGKLAITAINTQDLPVILGVTLVATVAVVLANIVVDIVYAFLDPRISYG
jgi:peptide/nickel transport system permease protein